LQPSIQPKQPFNRLAEQGCLIGVGGSSDSPDGACRESKRVRNHNGQVRSLGAASAAFQPGAGVSALCWSPHRSEPPAVNCLEILFLPRVEDISERDGLTMAVDQQMLAVDRWIIGHLG
jgi:hypothetical protein